MPPILLHPSQQQLSSSLAAPSFALIPVFKAEIALSVALKDGSPSSRPQPQSQCPFLGLDPRCTLPAWQSVLSPRSLQVK